MLLEHAFARGETFPSWWANAVQRFVSVAAFNFGIVLATPTTIRVPAGPDEDAVAVAVKGAWRWVEANVDRAHPGGAAGTYTIWVTAAADSVDNTPLPGTDHTDRSFALAITSGAAPGGVALAMEVGTLSWDGAAITEIRQHLGGLGSPELTGTPTAPTAAVDRNTNQVASCAFVLGQAASAGTPAMDGAASRGVSPRYARADHVHPTDSSRAPLATPAFTGNPTGPTPAANDSSTSLATTAYVIGQAATVAPLMDGVAAVGASTRWARQDHVHPTDSSRAPLASPALTGLPSAPTAAADTNSTVLATTAYVIGQAGAAMPLVDGAAAVGASLRYARQDHVHPTDGSRAPVANPTFTGTATAPTFLSTGATVGFAMSGGVAEANWLLGPGNYRMTFFNDNANTATIGTGDVVFGGRTYRPKAAMLPDGGLLLAAYLVVEEGQSTRVSLGDVGGAAGITFGGSGDASITRTGPGALQTGSWAVGGNLTVAGTAAFTGAPTAPTPAVDTNSTRLATTAYVLAQASNAAPLGPGGAAAGGSLRWARADHVHPKDPSKLDADTPSFVGAMTGTRTNGPDVVFAATQSTAGATGRWAVNADGSHHWGPGNAARDTHFLREGPGALNTPGDLRVEGTLRGKSGLKLVVGGGLDVSGGFASSGGFTHTGTISASGVTVTGAGGAGFESFGGYQLNGGGDLYGNVQLHGNLGFFDKAPRSKPAAGGSTTAAKTDAIGNALDSLGLINYTP